jgi:hypothetical protein
VCTDGEFRCSGQTSFQKCDHGNWVDFQCGPGTVCYPKGQGLILCDYGQSKSYY